MFFLLAGIGGYVNVQIVYLLRDEEMFAVSADYQGRVTSRILLLATMVGLIWTFIAGFIYDLCQRRFPMFIAVLLAALFLMLCPRTSPSEALLILVRCGLQMCLGQLSCAPLILDYIKQESRGKGSALTNLGLLIGETFAMSVLFGISRIEGVSQQEAFSYSAAIIAVLSFPLLGIIRNVEIKSKTTQTPQIGSMKKDELD